MTSEPGTFRRRAILLACPIVILCVIPVGTGSRLIAQGSAGSSGSLEPRSVVDFPTAGMIPRGNIAFDVEFYGAGGVDFGCGLGIFDRLSAGISYGGSGLIGSGTPVMNATPGFNVKLRLLEESVYVPALALGFDSQGHDGYLENLDRYAVKSPGLYAVVSKNYAFLGYLSVHGGANYSLERADGNRNVNLFGGVEKTIGPFLSYMIEYNLGLNDPGANSTGPGNGYLGMALRCSLGGGLTAGVSFKDLTHNAGIGTLSSRTVRLEYVRPL
jgi:hypothetical protein